MEAFSRLAAWSIDLVRIHRVTPETRNGVAGFLKVRKPGMGFLIFFGNIFLAISRSGIRMFPGAADWQARELAAFRLLHPGFAVEAVGRQGVFSARLPGIPMAELPEISPASLSAAAAELHRVHQLRDATGAFWSHGDPHLQNLLYAAEAGRCFLMDCETEHVGEAGSCWRRADDLLVVVLDLLSRPQWRENVALFLQAYGEPAVVAELRDRLGRASEIRFFERILWKTRTHYLPHAELLRRVPAALAQVFDGKARRTV